MAILAGVSEILGLGGVAAATAGTYAFFHWFGSKEVSDEAKVAVSRWFANKKVNADNVTGAYREVFNWVYSSRLLSWGAIWRSTLYSTFLYVIYLCLRSEVNLRDPLVYTFESLVFLANVISDYISLFLIKRHFEAGERSPIRSLLSASLTALAVLAVLYVTKIFLVAIAFAINFPFWGGLLQQIVDFIPERDAEFFRAVLNAGMWPAIGVHAWIPLMSVSMFTLRAATYFSKYVEFLRWLLKDGKENPFEAVAYAAASIVFAIGMIWKGIDLLKA